MKKKYYILEGNKFLFCVIWKSDFNILLVYISKYTHNIQIYEVKDISLILSFISTQESYKKVLTNLRVGLNYISYFDLQ